MGRNARRVPREGSAPAATMRAAMKKSVMRAGEQQSERKDENPATDEERLETTKKELEDELAKDEAMKRQARKAELAARRAKGLSDDDDVEDLFLDNPSDLQALGEQGEEYWRNRVAKARADWAVEAQPKIEPGIHREVEGAEVMRQFAHKADADYMRYRCFLADGLRVCCEVKNKLYQHGVYGKGTKKLLVDVSDLLQSCVEDDLLRASRLQASAEEWAKLRRRIIPAVTSVDMTLGMLQRRRAEELSNKVDQYRAACDDLWHEIHEGEAELRSLARQRARLLDGPRRSLGASSGLGDAPDSPGAGPDAGVAGAHALLQAFATVLQPHINVLVPEDPKRRTPVEAIVFEFLSAAADGGTGDPGPDV